MLTATATNAFGTAIDNGYHRHLQRNQPELTTLCPDVLARHLTCVGVRQELDKEMIMIAALKKLYEYHAENCVKAAEITVDTRQREEYLNLARQWIEAAAVLQTRRH